MVRASMITASRRSVVVVALTVMAGSLAALSSFAAPPRVVEIKVPQPTPPPPPPPPPPAGAGTTEGGSPAAVEGTTANVGVGGPSRRRPAGLREVKGESPAFVSGRYEVVQVTINGETEDFRIKMAREGMALKSDCVTERLIFDFGEASMVGLPNVLTVADQQRCTKGGLGQYANELAVRIPGTWTPSENGLGLSLPQIDATASLVRVKRPTRDELHTPLHWQGPEAHLQRGAVTYYIVAEYSPRRKDGELPGVLHFVTADAVFHLEPEPPESPFGR